MDNRLEPLRDFKKYHEPLDSVVILCDPSKCVEKEVQHVG